MKVQPVVKRDTLRLAVGMVAPVVLTVLGFWGAGRLDYTVVLGALLGFLIVYIADEKKLHFDVRAPFWGQVLKLVLGLALIVGIKAGLKPLLVSLFAGSQAESFVRYFLLVLFAGIVWPLTFPFFAKLGRKGNAA